MRALLHLAAAAAAALAVLAPAPAPAPQAASRPSARERAGRTLYRFGEPVELLCGTIVGWALAGDMDGDGDPDVVAGGGGALYVFENLGGAGRYARHGSLDATGSIGANGAVLLDVDGDRDLDVVSALYADDLTWWENPGALAGGPWTSHEIASVQNSYLHDLVLADVDGDGVRGELVANLDVGNSYWAARIRVLWLRPGDDPKATWEVHTIEAGADGGGRPEGALHGHAGLDVGDLDGDGDADLAFSNGWYEAPADPRLRWRWHPVSGVYGCSNSLARDLDEDGDLDLVVAAGHHGFGVYWYENLDGAAGAWSEHTIDAGIEHPEGLAVVDLDEDGRLEVVATELLFQQFTAKVHHLYVFDPVLPGAGWRRTDISPLGRNHHNFQLVRMDDDCRLDVLSQTAGDLWVSVLRNRSSDPVCR